MSRNVMFLIQEQIGCIKNYIALLGPFEQVTREMSVEKINSMIVRNLQEYLNFKTAGYFEENAMTKEMRMQLY